MGIDVKFCPCNFEDDLKIIKERLMERSNLNLIEERCLLYCGQCLVKPFSIVNGENIAANDADELLLKIEHYIDKYKQEN
ncbi:hypothetical protein AF332_27750 [Sporosarcina globispora]|uniref:DUF1450 domain-containing protein n=1 Tax=Sporosarcina globispora TaxID=1459 RepID=A0A0M0G1T4_SPOGL|nr:DUF1450 domain-containing protein [Sporosarcina globispora]KON83542.1 hypothetical protein AF332_27750 [Sporosarcina globispora]